MRLLTFSAILWFLADQISKLAVLHWAGLLERGVIEVFPPLLVFRLGYNTGINFGALLGRTRGDALGSGCHRARHLGLADLVGAHGPDAAHRTDLGGRRDRRGRWPTRSTAC